MADPIAGLPYWEVRFDQDGRLLDDDGLVARLPASGVRELFVFSHGWNNSETGARSLYAYTFDELAHQIDRFAPAWRGRVGAVGVLWPSLLFPEDAPDTPSTPSTPAELATALAPAFAAPQQAQLAELTALLEAEPQDPEQLTHFHRLVGGLVTSPALAAEDKGQEAVLTKPTGEVFGALAGLASEQGDAQDFPNPFKVLWHGAREALRTASYYEMKNRAGVIGRDGLGPLLGRVAGNGLRVHLIGHSFGARLVSYALPGLPDGIGSPVASLLLVQGAFSHFGFADPLPTDSGRHGFLAPFFDRVAGPLQSTFSLNDRAVGWWYPAASMLSNEDDQAASDLTYRWGGLGHDGFQQDGAERFDLKSAGDPYPLLAGHFYRLCGDQVISKDQSPFSGAHSDIRHPEVVWAALAGATTGVQLAA
ncbi:serine-threonine protein kinase [Kitasatospora sp. NPDC002040]|uniref:serine-threonine protein kinase n=1 Tax=Kitasatospora sp. NPDC002040 TaxID=3154661 RepID=UPI003325425E